MGRGWFVFLNDTDNQIVNDIFLAHRSELLNITKEQVEEVYKELLEKLKTINEEN